ncbi:MAG: hypothetical protein KDK70_24205, partial [Myxococcales bacterium]|nr:hypothetical protein [Myxococcales bacterium]
GLVEALTEFVGRPMQSREQDIVLRYSWQAWHHGLRDSVVPLLIRAHAPPGPLVRSLVAVLDEPWNRNIHGVLVSAAQCRLRAQALRGLANMARRSIEPFTDTDIERIGAMLSVPGRVLAMHAATALVSVGARAAVARSPLFAHGLVHERWPIVEACARVVLAIDGYQRDDDPLWMRLLGHPQWQVRARTAQVLSQASRLGPRVVSRLEQTLEDPAYLVRKYVRRAWAQTASSTEE